MLDTTFGAETICHPIRVMVPPVLEVRHLNLWYGKKQALRDITMDVPSRGITAFIGPSGCGKTTLLKCFNRMHDDTRGVRITGTIRMWGKEIDGPEVDPPNLRRRFGWVAQKPDPFARSIYDNVAYGPRIHGIVPAEELAAHVEDCLTRANLWDEVKMRLLAPAFSLSVGQQQRLCIARALSTKPEVLLMDEPTASVDPLAAAAIEDLIRDLAEQHAVIIITHSMMQARRLADRVCYFHLGDLVETGPTAGLFKHPADPRTQAFI
ncbi:MAG: phosphate ABC transporter ATP-binding protein, partial [Pseudomonadota bacterium]